ncbi:MAG: DNA polymerase III subunit alpha [Clostridia bacterium]|nr:DNA polymerase III subunit alpha [Clostridia bacterium]
MNKSSNPPYFLYHLHSEYSLLDSCTDFKNYVDLVKESGGTAIASTEHGLPRGWISKKMYCDEVGIKFVHGVEIYLTEQLEPKVRDNYHTVLLAKNLEGVKELNRLITISTDDEHSYYNNRISFEEFLGISDNIIKTSACLASPLNKLNEENPWFERLLMHYDYLEVQPHNHPEQIEFNKKLARLSELYKKPLVAGTDTHSSSTYKAECRSILLEAKRKSYGDEDAFDMTYKTTSELIEKFRVQGALSEDQIMSAISNTNLISDSCENFSLDRSIKYPILYGSAEEDERIFEKRVYESLDMKLQSGIIPRYQEKAFRAAVEEELRVFKKLNMVGFMLSMSDLIRRCKSQGMSIGPARGSVGGSRVAYVTDIIDLNPETWHTVFSRFCNEDRVEIGDIDIDVAYDDRPRIFEYITQRFGLTKTARVAAYGTLADKSVIDEVCRAFSLRPGGEEKYSLKNTARIKKEFEASPESARKKYPEVFYYYDGLAGTKISQSVHPAGMVISPITLDDNYGMFLKDGEYCLLMDMEEAHEVGAAKYDFLALKTVKVIRDTCDYIGIAYPTTHSINWNDEDVWNDMCKDLTSVFQFESAFAADCFKKFKPKNIFDMSLVTACIRPSGGSYRNDLLARKEHKNPSELIDELLADNLGYLIYQEDTIKFLQQICGLSGSEADNIRRAIGRKQKDRLDKALPSILEGYCSKSPKDRQTAENEANQFLQIIEDSASYQFGYNHSIAYCLLGYLCGYFRYYYPMEFITAYLNNAQNAEDNANGTRLMKLYGIKISNPKWGISKGDFFFDKVNKVIYKGLGSVKFLSQKVADELFEISKTKEYTHFVDVLSAIALSSAADARQIEILIKIDFFSEFGNQRELLRICDMFFETFKRGEVKQIKKASVEGQPIENIIKKYSNGKTKSGAESKSFVLLDTPSAMRECEDLVKSAQLPDLSDILKVQNFKDIMGYSGYISGKESDRRKLFIKEIFPLCRKKDGKQFGYSIITQSIGSGVESRFTVYNRVYDKDPISKDDIILCTAYEREGPYFTLTNYSHIYA